MLKDSHHFASEVSELEPTSDDLYILLDVKDFFLSGTRQQLCDAVFSSMTADMRKRVSPVLNFLLTHQYITTEVTSDQVWQVVLGGGQGFPHAGDVCDAAFSGLVESKFACDRDVRHRAGVRAYWRFKDGILIIGQNRRGTIDFARSVMDRGSFFKLVCEEIQKKDQ